MATSEIQIIHYHRMKDRADDIHFFHAKPEIGPVQFIDADGIGQEGWVDGIITHVHMDDTIVYMSETTELYATYRITVHSVHKDEVFDVNVHVLPAALANRWTS